MEKKNWGGKKKKEREIENPSFEFQWRKLDLTLVEPGAKIEISSFFIPFFFTVDDPCPVVRINAKLSSR